MTPLEQLKKHESEYISLGIRHVREPAGIRVPWEHTASAFNMKTPSLWITPEDLSDEALMQALQQYHVIGCYIFVPLEDYSFLARFPELWDLHILQGQNLRSLDFMAGMKEWFMLYVEDAVLEDLAPAFRQDRKAPLSRYYLGLTGCTVQDISALEEPSLYFSELIILQPEGTNEKARWKHLRAGTYRYYEYRMKTP